jgi:uroporphyrinogen III methyltransferase/synthase
VPEEQSAEGLVALLVPQLKAGARVLFPAGSRSLPTLRAGLTAAGAEVTQVEAYVTQAAPLDVPACHDWIERGAIGAVTFTSPSAVIELDRALGPAVFDRLLKSASAIALGSTTARSLAARGYPSVLATPPTLTGMAHTTLRLIRMRA